MTNNQKKHSIASAGTILFMALLFLLLWFIRLYSNVPEPEEGIEVAFGEVAEAGGYMSQQSEVAPIPAQEQAAPEPPSKPSDNELITQEDEEALALEQARKEAERKAREKAERERKEREAAEAAKKAKEQEAINKANQLGALFGQTGNENGSGDSQGDGQRGNPIGHGSSGGNNWSLGGRNLKGSLPQPSNDFRQEGKVVVKIRVNAAGDVIDAQETTGGNIADKQTVKLALEAARKAKFTEGEHDQIGTITYIFKLN